MEGSARVLNGVNSKMRIIVEWMEMVLQSLRRSYDKGNLDLCRSYDVRNLDLHRSYDQGKPHSSSLLRRR